MFASVAQTVEHLPEEQGVAYSNYARGTNYSRSAEDGRPVYSHRMSEKWDRKFAVLAEHVAGWSKDRSRKVGCVIVGPNNEVRSMGYNGFPRGVDDDLEERHQRPEFLPS